MAFLMKSYTINHLPLYLVLYLDMSKINFSSALITTLSDRRPNYRSLGIQSMLNNDYAHLSRDKSKCFRGGNESQSLIPFKGSHLLLLSPALRLLYIFAITFL